MRLLKIHFSKNRKGKIFSKMIMKYENVDFSHCAIEFRLEKIEEDVIYHSSLSSGVNFFYKPLFLKDNTIVESFEIEVTDEQYNTIMKKLIQSCGIKYATSQNLGIVLVDLAKRLGFKNVKNPWKQGYNCSELVYRHVLYDLIEEKFDPDTVKPSDVYNLLKLQE